MGEITTASGATGALTDGTGVSAMNSTKVVKDFVLDFLLTLTATLGAGATFDALDVGAIIAAPEAAGIAVAGAFIRTLLRSVLRWTTTN